MNLIPLFFACFICFTGVLTAEIKAVIFDFGGVMVNQPDREAEALELAELLGLPVEQVMPVLGSLSVAAQKGEITEKEMWDSFSDYFGIELPSDWQEQILSWYESTRKLNERMVAIVKRIEQLGYTTVLHTDTLPSLAELNDQLGWYDSFEYVIKSFDIGHLKNDPKALLYTLDYLDLNPSECLFIDDSEENIAVANEVGLDTIRFKGVFALKMELLRRKAARKSSN